MDYCEEENSLLFGASFFTLFEKSFQIFLLISAPGEYPYRQY